MSFESLACVKFGEYLKDDMELGIKFEQPAWAELNIKANFMENSSENIRTQVQINSPSTTSFQGTCLNC